jgi:hypothetical protein
MQRLFQDAVVADPRIGPTVAGVRDIDLGLRGEEISIGSSGARAPAEQTDRYRSLLWVAARCGPDGEVLAWRHG